MALPSQTPDSESDLEQLSALQRKLLDLVEAGETPTDIARRRYPRAREKKKREVLRVRLWRQLNKPEVQRVILERVQAGATFGLIGAADGLAARASRKTDAAKLLFEMTGVHTPRQKVEHGGEIKIKLEIPRPTFDRHGQFENPVEDDDTPAP